MLEHFVFLLGFAATAAYSAAVQYRGNLTESPFSQYNRASVATNPLDPATNAPFRVLSSVLSESASSSPLERSSSFTQVVPTHYPNFAERVSDPSAIPHITVVPVVTPAVTPLSVPARFRPGLNVQEKISTYTSDGLMYVVEIFPTYTLTLSTETGETSYLYSGYSMATQVQVSKYVSYDYEFSNAYTRTSTLSTYYGPYWTTTSSTTSTSYEPLVYRLENMVISAISSWQSVISASENYLATVKLGPVSTNPALYLTTVELTERHGVSQDGVAIYYTVAVPKLLTFTAAAYTEFHTNTRYSTRSFVREGFSRWVSTIVTVIDGKTVTEYVGPIVTTAPNGVPETAIYTFLNRNEFGLPWPPTLDNTPQAVSTAMGVSSTSTPSKTTSTLSSSSVSSSSSTTSRLSTPGASYTSVTISVPPVMKTQSNTSRTSTSIIVPPISSVVNGTYTSSMVSYMSLTSTTSSVTMSAMKVHSGTPVRIVPTVSTISITSINSTMPAVSTTSTLSSVSTSMDTTSTTSPLFFSSSVAMSVMKLHSGNPVRVVPAVGTTSVVSAPSSSFTSTTSTPSSVSTTMDTTSTTSPLFFSSSVAMSVMRMHGGNPMRVVPAVGTTSAVSPSSVSSVVSITSAVSNSSYVSTIPTESTLSNLTSQSMSTMKVHRGGPVKVAPAVGTTSVAPTTFSKTGVHPSVTTTTAVLTASSIFSVSTLSNVSTTMNTTSTTSPLPFSSSQSMSMMKLHGGNPVRVVPAVDTTSVVSAPSGSSTTSASSLSSVSSVTSITSVVSNSSYVSTIPTESTLSNLTSQSMSVIKLHRGAPVRSVPKVDTNTTVSEVATTSSVFGHAASVFGVHGSVFVASSVDVGSKSLSGTFEKPTPSMVSDVSASNMTGIDLTSTGSVARAVLIQTTESRLSVMPHATVHYVAAGVSSITGILSETTSLTSSTATNDGVFFTDSRVSKGVAVPSVYVEEAHATQSIVSSTLWSGDKFITKTRTVLSNTTPVESGSITVLAQYTPSFTTQMGLLTHFTGRGVRISGGALKVIGGICVFLMW